MASLPCAARITSRRTLRQLVAARGASPCASSSQAPSSCQHSRQSIRYKSSAAASSSSSSSGGSSSTPATPRSDAPLAAVPPIARSTPAVYAALLPHQRATLTSLLARLNLPTDDDALLAQLSSALTHPSWTALRDGLLDNSYKKESLGLALSAQLEAARTASQGGVVPPHNAALAGLGNSLLGMITTEHLHLTYPNLPNRVLKAALSAHVGPQTSSDVAVELGMGAKGVMKWDVSGEDKVRGADGKWRKRSSKEVLAQAMRAAVGLIFQTRGLAQTRSFVLSHFLSRLPLPPPISSGPVSSTSSTASSSHPLAPLLKFTDPKRNLSLVLQRYNLEKPQSRLIAETGRLSQNAVFGVGVYSGSRKVGEGWGSAIRMAEYRAAEDALRRLYLSPAPALASEEVPSSTLDTVFAGSKPLFPGGASPSSQGRDIWAVGEDLMESGASGEYRPRKLGESEVVFGSKA